MILPGCGGGSDTSSGATIAPKPEPPAKTTPTKPEKPPAKKQRRAPAGELCQSQVGGFLGSMDSLRRRLAVGVTYDQYINEVHGIRSTYRDVPVDKLELDCLSAVGIPGEKAFNRYIEAANDWGDCVSEAGCGSVTVEPVLQRRWRIASHFLSEAESGLRAVSGAEHPGSSRPNQS